MPNLTIGIPTYNNPILIKESLNRLFRIKDYVDIHIQDDFSREESSLKLQTYIKFYQNKDMNITYKKNKENLGPFRNKYQTVMQCKREFVYLLDQDNLMSRNTLRYIKKNNSFVLKTGTLYFPSEVHMFSKNLIYFDRLRKRNTIKPYIKDGSYSLRGLKSFIDGNNSDIKIITKHHSLRSAWLLNLGNFIVNKERYLEFLEAPFNDPKLKISSGDALASVYYWIKNSGELGTLDNLSHHHRLHDSSNWREKQSEGIPTVDKYLKKIKQL